MFDHERRGPSGFLIASNFPQLLARVLVEGVEKRVSFMIPANDQCVLVKHGRTAFAMGMEGVHPAEIFLPDQIAFQIEAMEPARTEENVEACSRTSAADP